jgi:hypothetical protein
VLSIKEFRQDIPGKLVEIVEKCMEERKEDRYQSVQEILDEIKKIDTEPTSLEMGIEIPGQLEDEKEIIPYGEEDMEDSVASGQDKEFLITLSPGDNDFMEETIESREGITEGRDFPAGNSGLTTGDNDLLEETIESSERLSKGRDFPAENNGLTTTTDDNDLLEETIESSERLTKGMKFPSKKSGLTKEDNDSLEETIDSGERIEE